MLRQQFIDSLLRESWQAATMRRRPTATYRLQLHSQFTFQDAARLAPFLRDLGISHVYCSPYLKARAGSTHGYDITDHQQLNPEIGSEADYAVFLAALADNGLGQILDTVPNHMGIVGNENVWWNDVLENGTASRFAEFFDIAWDASPRPELRGRLLLPTLGEPYGKVLEAGQLHIEYCAGALKLTYFDHRFPIDPGTYDRVLAHNLPPLDLAAAPDSSLVEYHSIMTAVKNLPGRFESDPVRLSERQREKEVIKRRLAQLTEQSELARGMIEERITAINGQPGNPRSFDRLDAFLDQQPYRLAYWRVAADEINYRRFFDVNELAALSMEKQEVFDAAHALPLRLLVEGKVDGLRIDHPDGLFDPRQYLERVQVAYVLEFARQLHQQQPPDGVPAFADFEEDLRDAIRHKVASSTADAMPLYLLVEKILGRDEAIPQGWPVHGTSGYHFLNMVGGLWIDELNQAAVTASYARWIDDATSFDEVVYRSKNLILRVALASELYMLSYQLDRLAQKSRWTRDYTLTTLRHALREVIACFPVYRSYIAEGVVDDADRKHVHAAIRRAKARSPAISVAVFNFVQDMLLLHYPESATDADQAEQRRFVGKFEQVTAPVMAKGVEDTAFYNYNRLVALNEVGGDPGRFGIMPAEWHRYNAERQQHWPLAMSATTTHDTKRSEDVRARLCVLSEMPDAWEEAMARFSQLNEPHRQQADNAVVPDRNEECFIYQTLLGAWPLEPYTADAFGDFIRRIQAYMIKSLHEAKVHSSWINSNQEYDNAMQHFVAAILGDHDQNPFVQEFLPLVRRVSHCGMLNSLSQVLLKIAAPGVPDIYRGTELWDFSLVDPDNRRPVDYDLRRRLLRQLDDSLARPHATRRDLARQLLDTRADGQIKLYLTREALRCRREHPDLFTRGDYFPLETQGSKARHAIGFAREWNGTCAIAAVARLPMGLIGASTTLPTGARIWQHTALILPPQFAARQFTNILTGVTITPGAGRPHPFFLAAELFADLPVALLLSK